MKVGNIAQAVMLSIVAVAAIGFLILQLKGKSVPRASLASPNSTASPYLKNATLEMPRTVYGDPFTHPALPRRQPAKKAEASPNVSPGATGRGVAPNRELQIPFIPGASGSQIGITADTALSQSKPGPEAEKGTTVLLTAVVSEPKAVAFISIDGKPPRPFVQGDAVTEHATIAGIRQGGVDFQLPNRRKALSVGGTTKI